MDARFRFNDEIIEIATAISRDAYISSLIKIIERIENIFFGVLGQCIVQLINPKSIKARIILFVDSYFVPFFNFEHNGTNAIIV